MSPAFGFAKSVRLMLLAGVAAVAMAGCAMNSTVSPDYSGQPRGQAQQSLAELSARYKANPGNTDIAINFAAALRAQGQSGQAVAVLEISMANNPGNVQVSVAYAKALTAEGPVRPGTERDRPVDPSRCT